VALTKQEANKRFALRQQALVETNPALRYCGFCRHARDIGEFQSNRGTLTKLCTRCRAYQNKRGKHASRIVVALRKHYPAVYADLVALTSKDNA
jgi:CRISPR/Cas system-associated protein Cas10 (large subunit of type III CRISPR-Cas system)